MLSENSHIKPTELPHGSLLSRKALENPALQPAKAAYDAFISEASTLSLINEAAVERLVEIFNIYRNVSISIFESGKNVPQENLRSTMIEEFFSWLFKDIFVLLDFRPPNNLKIGKSVNSYVSLTFAPHSFGTIFDHPNPRVAKKDQDFAIGATFKLRIESGESSASSASEILIPIVAIECKTYLAKNHLDMCSATASSIKHASPYCMYIIAAEFIKMDKAVYPELSEISEIYVLCKAHNSDRQKRRDAGLPPHVIHSDLVVDLFLRVLGHLRRTWWDPASAISHGRVISRPF
jgi:hypothetical protein